MKPICIALLASALSLVLTGTVIAQDKAATDRELAAARAELDRAARRYSELARGQAETARGDAARAREQASTLRARVAQMQSRPVIGVLLAPDDQEGARITGVTPEGGAAKAGLRSGDRLVSVNGTEILGSTGTLRVENARKLLSGLSTDAVVRLGYARDGRRANASVTPQVDRRIAIYSGGDLIRPDGKVFLESLPDGGLHINADSISLERFVTPEISEEVARVIGNVSLRTGEQLDGLGERLPRLVSAFRWNGLNLASVDADLGRYFGSDKGVLVLSTGELEGLRAGDVIQRVDGKAVASPREVMDTLRGKDEGDTVSIDYLRDRRNGQARVAIPKLMAWPPAPPAPPAAPAAPPAAPKAPAAPPAPPAPPRVALDFDGAVLVTVAQLEP